MKGGESREVLEWKDSPGSNAVGYRLVDRMIAQ
jgi:hypothetical protein